MVVQYPRIANIYKSGTGTRDANGNWIVGNASVEFQTPCRTEVNTKSQYIYGADGKQIVYRCIVYMPLPVQSSISPNPETPTPNVRTYAGRTLLHVVTPSEQGTDTIEVEGFLGGLFTLRVDGRPLQEDTEFERTATGFKVKGAADPVISGQRFELTPYYQVSVNGTTVGVSNSGDFWIKPGATMKIYDGARLILEDTVKQFSKGQMNMRVWI